MTQSHLVAQITAIAEPLIESLNLTLWGIEVALGPRSIVRVFVESDAEGGVTIDQCADLSRLLGLSLDVEDVVPGAYMLEVSSPGLERQFFSARQLKTAVGQMVELTLLVPNRLFPGRKRFRGMLADASNDIFTLRVDDIARPGEHAPLLEFRFEETRKIKQLHFFPEKTPPGKPGTVKKKQQTATKSAEAVVGAEEQLRPLTEEEKELLAITGGSEAL